MDLVARTTCCPGCRRQQEVAMDLQQGALAFLIAGGLSLATPHSQTK